MLQQATAQHVSCRDSAELRRELRQATKRCYQGARARARGRSCSLLHRFFRSIVAWYYMLAPFVLISMTDGSTTMVRTSGTVRLISLQHPCLSRESEQTTFSQKSNALERH